MRLPTRAALGAATVATALAVTLALGGAPADATGAHHDPGHGPAGHGHPHGDGHGDGFRATVHRVDRAQRDRMVGVTWKEGCPVPIRDLRIIDMSYYGFDGRVHRHGRLMVHRDIVKATVAGFHDLYRVGFPIRRMRLIEAYGGSDDDSMAADNTSAFNCRPITGGGGYSVHSYGKAIDINTVENPYVKGSTVLPPAGQAYVDRSNPRPGMLLADGYAVRAFTSRGFDWGGAWTSLKDYQHMEVPVD